MINKTTEDRHQYVPSTSYIELPLFHNNCHDKTQYGIVLCEEWSSIDFSDLFGNVHQCYQVFKHEIVLRNECYHALQKGRLDKYIETKVLHLTTHLNQYTYTKTLPFVSFQFVCIQIKSN